MGKFLRNLYWNLCAVPTGLSSVSAGGVARQVAITLKQTREGVPAKVTHVEYTDTKQTCRLLAKWRVKRG